MLTNCQRMTNHAVLARNNLKDKTMNNTITLLQEVLFDLQDAKHNKLLALSPDSELPYEFSSIEEWLIEQIKKLEVIEFTLTK